MVMAVQLGKFTKTKTQETPEHLKWINYMIYKVCFKSNKMKKES